MGMDQSQIIALYTQDQRIEVEYPDSKREVLPNLVRHVNTSGSGEGAIIYSQLNEDDVEQAIREQVAYFETLGQDFEWKVYSYDQPTDLKERLAVHGFEVEEAEAILVLDLEQAPATLFQPVRHQVRRITAPEDLRDVQQIEEEVWQTDNTGLIQYLAECLEAYPEQMSIYVADIDGAPASSGWIYLPKRSRFASLWGGSTVAQYRKQGLYTTLLAVRAQEARDRGVEYLTVDASPMSRPILEKFGFEMIAYAYACKWKVVPVTSQDA
jgi:hypothetical protein